MAMTSVGWRAASLAANALATALLAPLLIATAFMLAVESIATGRIFDVIAVLARFLPETPEIGVLVLFTGTLGCLALLVWACRRLPGLFPSGLILLGGVAESCFLGWRTDADPAIPIMGAIGMAVSGFQLGACRVSIARRKGGL